MTATPPLPIDVFLPAIGDALNENPSLVIVAEPGAGKTTRVPPSLMGIVPGAPGVLVVQPRRVAARMTARRMAAEMGEQIGERVGYHVRFDKKVSSRTQITVLTEGLLIRRIQSDPELRGIGCVVFDEFHERSINLDLSLAMIREIQESIRSDLKIIVMSATIDPKPISRWLDGTAISVPGRTHPVEISYAPPLGDETLTGAVSRVVRQTLKQSPSGHILVFLPGVGEINRVHKELTGQVSAVILPLHGRLPPKEQDRVFAHVDQTKVILATNIAETSITIDGIRWVIDSGLARRPIFDSAVGLERLETVRISASSADQRAGRAGRTGAGHCVRLWSQAKQQSLSAQHPPEISHLDLSNALLQVRAWGSTPEQFGWYETPPPDGVSRAVRLLTALDALDSNGLTRIGQRMAALPLHPRFSRALLSAETPRVAAVVAAICALATERDLHPAGGDVAGSSDLDIRLDAWRIVHRRGPNSPLQRNVLNQLDQVRAQLFSAVYPNESLPPITSDSETALPHLLRGFPDRVALRRQMNSERFLLASGTGARLSPSSAVKDASLILAVSLRAGVRGKRGEPIIDLATAISPSQLQIQESEVVEWDSEREAVIRFRTKTYGALVLDRLPAHGPGDADEISAALSQAACGSPLKAFGIEANSPAFSLLNRVRWLRSVRPDLNLPSLDAFDESSSPSAALKMLCAGHRSFSDLRRLNHVALLKGLLGFEQLRLIDTHAPSELTLPDGTQKKLQYAQDGEAPVLATRFERLFGLPDTPRVAGMTIKLHLLAPNMRPVQITSDLAGFWAETYAQVRKELRGRYPKHPWPENPLTAVPGIRRRQKR